MNIDKLHLRLDVDHACFNKYLSYFHLITGFPIPKFLEHVKETKKFLKGNSIERIWMFRPETCPSHWNEPHGLHVTNPKLLKRELDYVESRLGKVKYFSRHGFAHFVSGRIWTTEEIINAEQEYDLTDLSSPHIKHLMVSRLKDTPEKVSLNRLQQILFHPINIRTHVKVLITLFYRLVIEEVK